LTQFHDSPVSYLRVMRSALPLYDRLQDEVVSACADVQIVRMLDLGAGTGETSRRCLIAHPGANVVALDASEAMLEMAQNVLAHDAELRLGRLEDPLPEGRFDLIVSVLAVHHLDRAGKADLFKRVANRLAPGGRFVLGDVVRPETPVPAPTPIDPAVDFPDPVNDLLAWLIRPGLDARLYWSESDLAVIAADAPN
jgi:tRNA (cmo5U34)-methyltransferase